MPHFPHTPEALLGRNDSKNASTTCRGITASGRACRRSLASPKPSPARSLRAEPDAGVHYCWQHQEQAEKTTGQAGEDVTGTGRTHRPAAIPRTIREQSSIDTLVQRLGINASDAHREKKQNASQPTTDRAENPRTAYPSRRETKTARLNTNDKSAQRTKKGRSFWATLCCIGPNANDTDDYVEIVRHRKRVQQMQESARSPPVPLPTTTQTKPNWQQQGTSSSAQELPSRTSNATGQLLSLIPPNLSPSTTSALLTELAKPISPYDEGGYIYIFWLTPQSKERPGDSMARGLLTPTNARPQNSRRISDVMTEYSFRDDETGDHRANSNKRTIMLKIGRANNITRRMNEWQRQCGYALNLVRWYPGVPKSSSPAPSPQHRPSEHLYPDLSQTPDSRGKNEQVHKCPHVHRVERLIHLELAAKQVRRQCSACGKEHREWFQVDASQAGVKAIDETIRRWIRWAESQ